MDWGPSQTDILLNPRMGEGVRRFLHASLPLSGDFRGHIWLLTSGTTASVERPKCVALSKTAILASAAAVNRHLMCGPSDVWLNPLPVFHVGGLGILARSYLSGARMVDFSGCWCPERFLKHVCEYRVTLTSLVPTQLHDLVSLSRLSPSHLRAVVVGGGRLEESLRLKAAALGWNLLPSYGLTEACSQVATGICDGNGSRLKLIGHLEVRITDNGYIALKGASLLTSYAYVEDRGVRIVDPKQEGWFVTADKGTLEGEVLVVEGRSGDFIKVGGESVELNPLRTLLETVKAEELALQSTEILAIPDARLGHVLHIAVEGVVCEKMSRAIARFQEAVLPYERARKVHEIQSFPRTELGKVRLRVLGELVAKAS